MKKQDFLKKIVLMRRMNIDYKALFPVSFTLYSITGDGKIAVGRSPRITPLVDKRKCFFTAWFNFLRQRKLLGDEWLEGSSPLFIQPRNTSDYGTNPCLFHPKAMSEDAIGGLAKNMAIEAGLAIKDRKVTNMSFRQLNFHHQIQLDITPEQGQSLSNHFCRDTRKRYNKKNHDMMEVIGGAMLAAATGSPALLPPPAGVRAVQHLKGPRTYRDNPPDDLEKGTRVDIVTRRETSTTSEAGESVQKTLTKFDVLFDGVKKSDDLSLHAAYMKHVGAKYVPVERKEEDEEDMLNLCGDPHPNCPPVPVLGERDPNIQVTQVAGNGPRYSGDGRLLWKSTKQKEELKKKEDLSAAPKKKAAPKVAKEPVKKIEEGDLVFARESLKKKGMKWPAEVRTVHKRGDEVTGCVVEYFCHYEMKTGVLTSKQVKPVNQTALNSWGAPSLSRRGAKITDAFARAMKKLEEEMVHRGMEFVLPVKKEKALSEQLQTGEENKENELPELDIQVYDFDVEENFDAGLENF